MKKVDELAGLAKDYHKALSNLHNAGGGDIGICTGCGNHGRMDALHMRPKSLDILAKEAGVEVIAGYGERYFDYDGVRFFALIEERE